MGLDGMRVGGGRCSPLFVGGLLVACFLLVCNWWSLSTENLELLRQLDDLSEQFKIRSTERDTCVMLRENVEGRYKRLEEEIGGLHVRLQVQNEMKKQNEQIAESLTMCKSELDSLNKLDATRSATLETLRLEKDRMATELDTKREENDKLKADLQAAQSDLEKLKLSIDAPKESKPVAITPSEVTRAFRDEAQLGPVDEAAVDVAVSGQRGMKYHGIPILPGDPPGVARQSPRLSVTMLKGPTSNPIAHRDPLNNANGRDILDDLNAEPNNNMSGGGEEAKRFIMPDEAKNEVADQL